jgi:hypothetical protein
VKLLTTELVANAVVHARSAVELVASHLGDLVRVEVHDDDEVQPALRQAAEDATSGRGLGLVDSHGSHAKAVWFELEVPDGP